MNNFRRDTLPFGQIHRPATDAAGVLDYLWRRGKVPGHIKIRIVKADNEYTFFFLTCSCMFTSGAYHPLWAESIAPFQSLGPGMPHTWKFLKISQQQREAWNHDIETQYWDRMVALNGKVTLGNSYLDLLQQIEERRIAEG